MNVTLHRSHDDDVVFRVFRIILSTLIILISLHIWLQHCHSLLHHAGRLHHLRQEHLAVAKQAAHLLHGRHQVVVYHAQRSACLLVSLLGVSVYIVGHALEHGVFYAFVQGALAPVCHRLLGGLATAGSLLGILLSLYLLGILYESF